MALRTLLTVAMLAFSAPAAVADRALIAVATNFAEPAKGLEKAFQVQHDGDIDFVFGSTGKLYAQIVRGAPFDAFLAADQERPRLLAEQGLGGTPFTYAEGLLVWWPRPPSLGKAETIAIANPKLAPYGRAASEVINGSGRIQDRLVFGENVGQAFAMVQTGSASVGLVALSSVKAITDEAPDPDSVSGYAPILQDAIMLNHGLGNPTAGAFLEFLRSSQGAKITADFGYRITSYD